MPIGLGNNMRSLSGLSAADRTEEEKKVIEEQKNASSGTSTGATTTASVQVAGTQNTPTIPRQTSVQKPVQRPAQNAGQDSEPSFWSNIFTPLTDVLKEHKDELDKHKADRERNKSAYQKALDAQNFKWGVGRGSVNSTAEDYVDKISKDVSSSYKKFNGTDKLPLDNEEKKKIAAEYDARKQVFGEQSANNWLDAKYKNTVADNQSWWEQALNSVGHFIPTMEGAAVSLAGMATGSLAYISNNLGLTDFEDYNGNENLGWWEGFLDATMDNPITRYGNQLERAGASHVSDVLKLIGLSDKTAAEKIAEWESTKTKSNPEGISDDAILTTTEQDNSIINATTPWQALYSGGFTAFSMLVGAGEAKAAGWLFNGITKGINWANKAGIAFKTEKALEKGLEAARYIQKGVDAFVIPGLVGTVEGAQEGLQAKMDVEREARESFDEEYKAKMAEEAKALFESEELNPMIEERTDRGKVMHRKYRTYNEALQATINAHAKDYKDIQDQIDWAASKAGVHTFYANSLINGMINSTLKAGVMSSRVQEALRRNRLTGWWYRDFGFGVDDTGKAVVKTPKWKLATDIIKEPLGEGLEEYEQTVASDVFTGSAENNIGEFIKAKYSADGNVKVGDTFSSDYAAAWTAFTNSLTSKESIQSATIGAVSSVMGTFSAPGRGYHRDSQGRLVQNSLFSPRNFTKGLNEKGEQESTTEYLRRITPWRSGAMNAYFDYKKEKAEAEETAGLLTEWLKDPQNKAKWDGLVGTSEWLTKMEKASESNDQFSYRKAQMGKAVNDVLMLSKLKGTKMYDAIMEDLQRSATMKVESEEAQGYIEKLRANKGEELEGKTDEEIIEKINKNANEMLGLMSQIEKEGSRLDTMLGKIDDDTKQSLIYGKLMEKDFTARKEQLESEINEIKAKIANSRGVSNVQLEDDLKKLIAEHGSLNAALKAQSQWEEAKNKAQEKVKELEKIDKDKRSDKQNKELENNKNFIKKADKELATFDALYKKDENEKVTKEIDSSLAQLVLNEQEIMELDAQARSKMLSKGASKFYNATHQDRQKVDELNLELDELNAQIETLEDQNNSWKDSSGRVKKGHNKQVIRNNAKIKELTKQKEEKMRALHNEQNKMDTKEYFSDAQQAVIDNLVQQGTAIDEDFVDKIVDYGRLDDGIKAYHSQYQAILSDPKLFQNYVQRARQNAKMDLTRRRASYVANLQDYKEFSQELDKLMADASPIDQHIILSTLREENKKQKDATRKRVQDEALDRWESEDNGELIQDEKGNVSVVLNEEQRQAAEAPTNIDKYIENSQKAASLVQHFSDVEGLTSNDKSLLADAFQYLASNGIDLTDRNAVVEALANPDERGNIGGTFRQYVEALNSKRVARQETVVPTFTSTGQVVSQYVELLDYLEEEEKTRQATSVKIEVPSAPTVETQDETPASAAPSGGGILNGIMGTSPDDGQLVGDDQVVRTGAIADAEKKNSDKESIEDDSSRTDIEKAFLGLIPDEELKSLSTVENIIANTKGSDEAKEIAKKYFIDIADALSGDDNSLEDITSELSDKIEALHKESDAQINDDNVYSQAAGILTNVHKKLQVQNKRAEANAQSTAEQNRGAMSSTIQTLDMNYYKEHYPNSWAVEFSEEHKIGQWLKDNYPLSANTPIYFITDSEWTSKVIESVGKDVYVSGQMPVVAAVHVDEPKDKNHTTAIEVDGLWYQPIGILPANEGKTRGAKRCEVIRKLASSEAGRAIVTEDGTPDGKPLTTVVSGTGNYLHANVNKELKRKGNTENTDFFEAIIETLPEQEKERLRATPRRDVLEDEVYKSKRADFVRRLIWEDGKNNASGLNIHVVPNNYNGKGEGQPMGVIRKSLKDSVGRTSGKSLKEVLEGEDLDEVVNFNSLTQGVYNNVIRPLFMYSMMDQVRHKNPINARIITKEDVEKNPSAHMDEALRIQKVLNGYDGSKESNGLRGVRSFIHLRHSDKAGEKWSFVVKPSTESIEGEDTNTSKTIFDIYLKEEVGGKEVKIGAVQAGAKDSEGAKELLRNLLWDSEKGEIRDILDWQVSKRDIEAIRDKDSSEAEKEKAVENVAQLVDDGIFEFAGYSLDPYEANYITIKAPSTNNVNAPVNPQVVTANAGNAASPMPSGNSDGAVVTTDGEEVDPDSGMVVGSGGNAQGAGHGTGAGGSQVNHKLEEAKKIVEKIKTDSERFKLSADEKYYYIEDKKTGKREKYLRVTTVIGADNEVEQKVTIPDVLKKLKEKNPNIPTLSEEQIEGIKSSKDVASLLGITEEEVKRAWSEAKTDILKEGYGIWSTPSTSVGNTVDNITRDFFDGTLKDSYPNITQEALQVFIKQLESFKHDLDVKGIHIVSEGVMAFGEITTTDENGKITQVKVAGTLDLLGYDDEGNFYIFDMKTVRDHSSEKLKKEKAKWSRQISMYADLLKQKYGIAISEDRLRIIPINVNYPTPYGGTKTDKLNKRPRYSENDKGQLQMDTSYKIDNPENVPDEDKTDFMGSNPEMQDVIYEGLFRPGYHKMDINWDLLSSEDQDIAMGIEDEIENNKDEGKDTEFGTPQNATIDTGESNNFDFGNALESAVLPDSNTDSSASPTIVPNGSTLILPPWKDLSDDAKEYLGSLGYYEAKYQEALNNPGESKALQHQLNCAGVL